MPEARQISEELLLKFFEEKDLDVTCAACHRKELFVSSRFVAAQRVDFSHKAMLDEGGQITYDLFIPVFCGNCSHTIFFNASEIFNASVGKHAEERPALRLVKKEDDTPTA
jgi:predicted nucleic-acid-binding Zn-ribbon protein